MNNPEIEQEILEKLKKLGFKCILGGKRYSGNEEYHNWYMVGLNDTAIFGELEFSANPIWRINWWHKGKYHRDTGFILTSFNRFINHIYDDCIPGFKHKKLDEKLKEINEDFI